MFSFSPEAGNQVFRSLRRFALFPSPGSCSVTARGTHAHRASIDLQFSIVDPVYHSRSLSSTSMVHKIFLVFPLKFVESHRSQSFSRNFPRVGCENRRDCRESPPCGRSHSPAGSGQFSLPETPCLPAFPAGAADHPCALDGADSAGLSVPWYWRNPPRRNHSPRECENQKTPYRFPEAPGFPLLPECRREWNKRSRCPAGRSPHAPRPPLGGGPLKLRSLSSPPAILCLESRI